ncbi:MAG: ribonuclease PH [Dehalococcoidales bacterium]|nr:ribonuclease PH [Dehalococcoidales bacterium]
MKRIDGRAFDDLREIKITPGFQKFAEGSALIELGKTRVICSASVDERVANFLKGGGSGWVTAEYSMLPRATLTRSQRETAGKVSGRSQEIQRFIGRSLRAVTDLSALGERTIIVDCDVIQADGGTRTASVTGAYVALYQALTAMAHMGIISSVPFKSAVAATSVGIVNNNMLLDLCYDEDFHAAVDFNVVMTGRGEFVEIQGTAEGKPFNKQAVNDLISLAEQGIKRLFEVQDEALRMAKLKA